MILGNTRMASRSWENRESVDEPDLRPGKESCQSVFASRRSIRWQYLPVYVDENCTLPVALHFTCRLRTIRSSTELRQHPLVSRTAKDNAPFNINLAMRTVERNETPFTKSGFKSA